MAEPQKEVTAAIVWPEISEEDKPVYANGVVVNHTPWDFALYFSQVLTPINPSKATPLEIKAKKVAIISFPVTLVRGLITALETNLTRYEELYGKVEIPKSGIGTDGKA